MIVSALCTPRDPQHDPIQRWFVDLLRRPDAFLSIHLPEIVDYEVRRGLLHVARKAGRPTVRRIQRLDELASLCSYLPIRTSMMRRAAELWAQARAEGRPTADGAALDGDVIPAAQAHEVGGIVATENTAHLARFVTSRSWRDLPS